MEIDSLIDPKIEKQFQFMIEKELIKDYDPELKYELKERIGKGSFGAVYLAVDRFSGKLIAIKKMYPNSEIAVQDIQKELQILKSLGKNKYIAEYYETFVKKEFLWICMEYVNSGALSTEKFKMNGFDTNELAAICSEILFGLKHLHSNKLIHRDIKLENLLINSEGEIKIVDFGISAILKSEDDKCKTQVGTPFMMAPEILNGELYDTRVDIWSMGMSILMLVEPDHPLFQQSPISALFVISSQDAPKLQKKYTSKFEKFMGRCLVKDSSKRSFTEDLIQNSFILSIQPTKKALLKNLAKRNFIEEDVEKIRRTATVSIKDIVESDNEGVIKIFLPNKSFRTILVREDETTKGVIDKMMVKSGFFFSELGFKLYFRFNNQERILEDEERPIAILKKYPKENGRPIFFLQQIPQKILFDELTLRLQELKKADLNEEKLTKEWLEKSKKALVNEKATIISIMINRVPKKVLKDFIKSCVLLYENEKLTMNLIKESSISEIAETIVVSELFNSTEKNYNKFLSYYIKFVGSDYAEKVLKNTIDSVLKESFDWQGDYQESQRKLLKITSDCFDDILASSKEVPKNIKKVCFLVQHLVLKCFPSSHNFLVPSQIFFLIFISPYLASTKNFSTFEKQISNDHQRSFFTLSKFVKSFTMKFLGINQNQNGKGVNLRESVFLQKDFYEEEHLDLMVKSNFKKIISFCADLIEDVDIEDCTFNSAKEIDQEQSITLIMRLIRKIPNFSRDIGVILNVLPRTPQDDQVFFLN